MIIPNSRAIKRARILQGLSLREVSGIVHYSTLSHIESGKCKNVTARTSKAICDALQIGFDELFTIADEGGGADEAYAIEGCG